MSLIHISYTCLMLTCLMLARNVKKTESKIPARAEENVLLGGSQEVV